MNLYELAVRVICPLLIERGLRRSCADDRICGLAEDGATSAGRDDDGVGGGGAHFHAAQIHRTDATSYAVSLEYGREKLPVLVLLLFSFRLLAADLLIHGGYK